jgi:glycosyltransferase involved in cell wall biosynthesis
MQPFLVAHLDMQNPGGGTAVLAWSLAALSSRFAVTVATMRPCALEQLDHRFGTSLAGRPIRVAAPAPAIRRALDTQARSERLKMLLLGRFARRLRRELGAERALSTSNELDLGGPALQYVHYPLASYVSSLRGLPPCRRAMAALYLALTQAPWWASLRRTASNVTLCNSAYTLEAYRRAYERDARVLHPPVHLSRHGLPWQQRAPRVLCVGRLAPEKRLMDAVAVVERARALGAALELELIGAAEDSGTRSELTEAARTRPWLSLQVGLDRAALIERLQRARYGLHMAIGEHFGIAVGELIGAGCIVLGHRSAGPREILAHDALTFESVTQAAQQLVRLTRDAEFAREMRAHCADRARLFSERAFMDGLLALVDSPAPSA